MHNYSGGKSHNNIFLNYIATISSMVPVLLIFVISFLGKHKVLNYKVEVANTY